MPRKAGRGVAVALLVLEDGSVDVIIATGYGTCRIRRRICVGRSMAVFGFALVWSLGFAVVVDMDLWCWRVVYGAVL